MEVLPMINERREAQNEMEFDNIVLQAMEKGLVGGKILYSDSTHIKANANKRKFEKIEVEVTPKEYIDQLDIDVNLDRENHNKKPLKPRKKKRRNKGD